MTASDAQLIDDKLFRYAVTAPADWHSNMRPEGGTFTLTDPVATQEVANPMQSLPGGVLITFRAHAYRAPDGAGGSSLEVEQRLRSPNTAFGGTPGVTWDEGPGEGAAHILHAAFIRLGTVFEATATIADDGRQAGAIGDDVLVVQQIFNSIAPY